MLALSVRAIRCPLYLLTGLIFVSKNDLWYCELQSHYTVVLLLFMKAFPLSEQCSKKAHDQFLADLASILPSNTTPLIVSDAGFKVPWYKSVEKLGWYWLSRVRGKVQYADLGAENWKPISNLHDMSSSHSKTLGYKRLTKSNQSHAKFYCINLALKAEKISARHGLIVTTRHLKSTQRRQRSHGF